MFANFDFSKFPIVIVNFNENIENNLDFQNFLDIWLSLYDDKKEFIFIFNTVNVGFPPIKYCFKMASFIKKIRRRNPQYLKRSIIIVKNQRVINLLNFIFFMQPPVAPVNLTYDNTEKILSELDNVNIIKTINPRKQFIPFL
jgi:hypothetical protein